MCIKVEKVKCTVYLSHAQSRHSVRLYLHGTTGMQLFLHAEETCALFQFQSHTQSLRNLVVPNFSAVMKLVPFTTSHGAFDVTAPNKGSDVTSILFRILYPELLLVEEFSRRAPRGANQCVHTYASHDGIKLTFSIASTLCICL